MRSTDDGISRRDAIKKSAAAAATAGVVWSAPRVEGLSLRPNYAAAASSALSWTAQVDALNTSQFIMGLEASAAVDLGVAIARTSVVLGFGLLAAAQGEGLDAASISISGISSPNGPVTFTRNADFAIASLVSTQVRIAPSPTLPLQLNGNFTCI